MLDYSTPLFHRELLHTTQMHQEVLERPDPTVAEQQSILGQLKELDKADHHLTKRWKELHESPNVRTALLAGILAYQEYLTTYLLQEYAGKSIPDDIAENWHDWLMDRCEKIDKHYSSAEKSEKENRLYQQMVALPLKEMMLDQEYVEARLKIAALGDGYIRRLIDQRDWPKLANALVKDRELALTLFNQKPLYENVFNDAKRQLVLRNLDEIQRRYFVELTNPTTYTISKYAKEALARQATQPTPHTSTMPQFPAIIQDSGETSAMVAAKGIYNKVITRLGLGGTDSSLISAFQSGSEANSSRASFNSTTPLLNSTKKAD